MGWQEQAGCHSGPRHCGCQPAQLVYACSCDVPGRGKARTPPSQWGVHSRSHGTRQLWGWADLCMLCDLPTYARRKYTPEIPMLIKLFMPAAGFRPVIALSNATTDVAPELLHHADWHPLILQATSFCLWSARNRTTRRLIKDHLLSWCRWGHIPVPRP